MDEQLTIHVIVEKARDIAVSNGCEHGNYFVEDLTQISRNKFMSMTERAVLQNLFHWFKGRNVRNISRVKLAGESGVDERTVTRAVRTLVTMGFIDSEKRPNKTNRFTLFDFSMNPYVVLSNVIRQREDDMGERYDDLGKAYAFFESLWKREKLYAPMIKEISKSKDAKERYSIAKMLVAEHERKKLERIDKLRNDKAFKEKLKKKFDRKVSVV